MLTSLEINEFCKARGPYSDSHYLTKRPVVGYLRVCEKYYKPKELITKSNSPREWKEKVE